MADNPLDVLKAAINAANKRLDALHRDRPASPSPGPVTPTSMDTSAIFRRRLSTSGPHFVGPDDAPDRNRRTLHSVDAGLVIAIDEAEPPSAAGMRRDITERRGKVAAREQASRDLDRAKAVLSSTSLDPAATHARVDELRVEVRRLAQVVTSAETASKNITAADIDRRQADLDGAIDRHREAQAGSVLDQLAAELPRAIVQTALQRASDRRAETGTE